MSHSFGDLLDLYNQFKELGVHCSLSPGSLFELREAGNSLIEALDKEAACEVIFPLHGKMITLKLSFDVISLKSDFMIKIQVFSDSNFSCVFALPGIYVGQITQGLHKQTELIKSLMDGKQLSLFELNSGGKL